MTLTEFKEKYSKPVYIGDGVFVEFDGYQMILKADRSDYHEAVHWIALEPSVFEMLTEYWNSVQRDAKALEIK